MVGSVQGAATASPNATFTAKAEYLPNSELSVAATAVGYDMAAWEGGAPVFDSATGGGDAETRPVNIYVDYYIKAALGSATSG